MLLQQANTEQQIRIRQAVNEDLVTRNDHLEVMKEWLKKQPHLPDEIDDGRLMNFLRGCSFSLEKCKRKLDLYFTTKTAVPEIFSNRDISRSELRKILEYIITVYLPTLTSGGRRVAIIGTTRINFETPDIADCFKIISMVGDVRLKIEECGVSGDIYVLDASSVISRHFLKVSPLTIKKFLIGVQEAFPIKIKEVHVINLTPVLEFLLNFVKPFLKEKIRRRIYLHQNLESLHQHVPKEMLPEEYGGSGGKMKDLQEAWIRILEEYREWFEKEDSFKVDESRRIGTRLNYDEIFGLEGSFRKLNID